MSARKPAHPDDGESTLVRFEGRRILDPGGAVLAELASDECWYTSEGIPCKGLAVPAPRAQPQVASADRDAARHAADQKWMQRAVEEITRIAATQETITSDDVWATLPAPRESRMMGNAFTRARDLGVIETTGTHRASQRTSENHSRPIQIWRSVISGDHSQQQLC